MKGIAVIAELNPLHNGHRLLLETAAKKGTVVCILSGNFVQRGEPALCDKGIRTQAALQSGADLVLELPVPWSMSTAANFALGGVSAAHFAGCSELLFGSECGSVEKLQQTAKIMQGEDFSSRLTENLSRGITFAAARQQALEQSGGNGALLAGANNNLGLCYMQAADTLNAGLAFSTLHREGAGHDSAPVGRTASASFLRLKMQEGDFEGCRDYIPGDVFPLFTPDSISDITRLERAIPAVLRTRSKKELACLPDISEGLENKLYSAIRLATGTQDLYNRIKVKRYTLARVRRLVLSAFLGLDNRFFGQPLPYIRVLGMNPRGEAYLKEKAPLCPVPVVVRFSDVQKPGGECLSLFETESRATDLFALCLNNPFPCGREETRKIIKTE